MSSRKPKEPTITIRGELAGVLKDMEGTNWTTSISKNNVKSVCVHFHMKHPTVELAVR